MMRQWISYHYSHTYMRFKVMQLSCVTSTWFRNCHDVDCTPNESYFMIPNRMGDWDCD